MYADSPSVREALEAVKIKVKELFGELFEEG
jgi:hypothetical protein